MACVWRISLPTVSSNGSIREGRMFRIEHIPFMSQLWEVTQQSSVVLTGSPGVGKSWTIAQFIRKCRKAKRPVLPVAAEDFEVRSLEELSTAVGLLIFPEAAIIIPSYFNLRAMGLYNTYAALILPQTAMSIAFGAFFLQPALRGIPAELIDCAELDGCRDSSLLLTIILPMLKPSLAALSVFFFLGTWNDFLMPSILVSSDSLRTLPFGLLAYQQRYTSNVPLIAAGTMISAAPVILFYIVFQRQVIQGITMGALKE